LISDSQNQFKETAAAGTSVVPTGKLSVIKEEFNAKLGDEVNQLTLTLIGTVEGLAYQNQDLQPISQALLSSQLPPGYELVPNELQVLSSPEPVSSASAQVSLAANLSSKARPVINIEQLKTSIAGKSIATAQQSLKSNPMIKGVEFIFKPTLARRLLGRVPATNRLELKLK